MSAKKLEAKFAELLDVHSQTVGHWREEANTVKKTVRDLANHKEQEETFSRLAVTHLPIVEQFPTIQVDLNDKLHSKVLELESSLDESVNVFRGQMDHIVALSKDCQDSARDIPTEQLIKQNEFKVPLAKYLESSEDIVSIYHLQYHLMVAFLEGLSSDSSAFDIAKNLELYQCPVKYNNNTNSTSDKIA